MKTPERQLEEWASDEIRFDCGDGPGVIRLLTREAWADFCDALTCLPLDNYRFSREHPDRPATPPDYLKPLRDAIRHMLEIHDSPEQRQLFMDALRSFFQPRKAIRFESLREICDFFTKVQQQALEEAIRRIELQKPPAKTESSFF